MTSLARLLLNAQIIAASVLNTHPSNRYERYVRTIHRRRDGFDLRTTEFVCNLHPNVLDGLTQLQLNKRILKHRNILKSEPPGRGHSQTIDCLVRLVRGTGNSKHRLLDKRFKYDGEYRETSRITGPCRPQQARLSRATLKVFHFIINSAQLFYETRKTTLLVAQEVHRQEFLKEKVICGCGCAVSKKHIRRHEATRHHMDWLESKTQPNSP